MRKWAVRVIALLIVLYAVLRVPACFDGGGTKGAPSETADRAERDGMLLRRVTLVVDSGAPATLESAWIERPAYTHYRFGILPRRRPLAIYPGTAPFLLSIRSSADWFLVGPAGGAHVLLLPGGATVTGFRLDEPLPDTIFVRAPSLPSDRRSKVEWRGMPVDAAAPRVR